MIRDRHFSFIDALGRSQLILWQSRTFFSEARHLASTIVSFLNDKIRDMENQRKVFRWNLFPWFLLKEKERQNVPIPRKTERHSVIFSFSLTILYWRTSSTIDDSDVFFMIAQQNYWAVFSLFSSRSVFWLYYRVFTHALPLLLYRGTAVDFRLFSRYRTFELVVQFQIIGRNQLARKMNIQLSTLFCICIALAIPLLVLSSSRQEFDENYIDDIDNDLDRFAKSTYFRQKPQRSSFYTDHYRKKAADFEQILRPCNQIPATGRGHEYADCVRSRMLLMGRRKRRQAN